MNDLAATNPDIHVLEQLAGIFRRRWKSILLFVVVGAVSGFLYAESLPPQYAASATVMVRSGFAADPVRPGIQTTTPEEEGQFLSQLELVKSSSVAALVAQKLGLEQDEAFAAPVHSGYKRLMARFGMRAASSYGAAAPTETTGLDRDAIVARLQAGVKALRAGRTYVAAISFQHADPAIAQRVAQAYAEAFRQTLAAASDAANSRARATIEAELAKATGEARAALEQKFQDVLISRALPGVDAVIISDAKRPVAPIAPRKSFLTAVGAIIGAALGALFAGWREMRDRGVRDGDLLARRLGTRFLGYAPIFRNARRGFGSSEANSFSLPADARISVSSPYVRFSETVRSAAVAAMAGPDGTGAQVIGIISVLPGEGKTLFSGNLAAQIGNRGKKVLLIDGHFRDPDLTGWLAGRPQTGLIDTLFQGKPASDVVLYDKSSNISLLPVAANNRTADPAAVFTSAQMAALLENERRQQDVIIIDLPALAAASDATAIEPLVDRFILVTEWGGPSVDLVATVLAGDPAISAKLAGVAVTKTDLRRLSKYVGANSRGAFQYRIG